MLDDLNMRISHKINDTTLLAVAFLQWILHLKDFSTILQSKTSVGFLTFETLTKFGLLFKKRICIQMEQILSLNSSLCIMAPNENGGDLPFSLEMSLFPSVFGKQSWSSSKSICQTCILLI